MWWGIWIQKMIYSSLTARRFTLLIGELPGNPSPILSNYNCHFLPHSCKVFFPHVMLGGGSNIFLCSSLQEEMIHFDSYFCKWVGSTTKQHVFFHLKIYSLRWTTHHSRPKFPTIQVRSCPSINNLYRCLLASQFDFWYLELLAISGYIFNIRANIQWFPTKLPPSFGDISSYESPSLSENPHFEKPPICLLRATERETWNLSSKHRQAVASLAMTSSTTTRSLDMRRMDVFGCFDCLI